MWVVESMQEQAQRWTGSTIVPPYQHREPVTIRPVEEGDLELVIEMHGRLSKESTFSRYLAARQPSPRSLERLCSLSGETGVAIVATIKEPNEKIVAMACYGVDPDDPTSAEPAVLVEDCYQGRGLGRRILWELYEKAVRNGVEKFVCYTHPMNQRVLCLIEGCGLPYESRCVDGLIEIQVFLKSASPSL